MFFVVIGGNYIVKDGKNGGRNDEVIDGVGLVVYYLVVNDVFVVFLYYSVRNLFFCWLCSWKDM